MVHREILYGSVSFLLLFGLLKCQETTQITTTDIISTELPLVEIITTVRFYCLFLFDIIRIFFFFYYLDVAEQFL